VRAWVRSGGKPILRLRVRELARSRGEALGGDLCHGTGVQ
jgi:hypothetical protein